MAEAVERRQVLPMNSSDLEKQLQQLRMELAAGERLERRRGELSQLLEAAERWVFEGHRELERAESELAAQLRSGPVAALRSLLAGGAGARARALRAHEEALEELSQAESQSERLRVEHTDLRAEARQLETSRSRYRQLLDDRERALLAAGHAASAEIERMSGEIRQLQGELELALQVERAGEEVRRSIARLASAVGRARPRLAGIGIWAAAGSQRVAREALSRGRPFLRALEEALERFRRCLAASEELGMGAPAAAEEALALPQRLLAHRRTHDPIGLLQAGLERLRTRVMRCLLRMDGLAAERRARLQELEARREELLLPAPSTRPADPD